MNTATNSNESVRSKPGQKKIKKVMSEFNSGALKSSSGQTVSDPAQARAIALSEARRAKKPVSVAT